MVCGFASGGASRLDALRISRSRSAVCERAERSRKVVIAQSTDGSDSEMERLRRELESLRNENVSLKGASASSSGSQSPEFVALGSPSLGKVGEDGRVIAFDKLDGGNQPRVIPYVGELKDISDDVLKSFPSTLEHSDREWIYRTGPLKGWNGPVLAVPSTYQILKSNEVAVVRCPRKEVGFAPADGLEQPIYVVFDRSPEAIKFEVGKFYLWKTRTSFLVGWEKELPDPNVARPVARILLALFEGVRAMKQNAVAFAEADPDFEF